jgi:hypothetical protein
MSVIGNGSPFAPSTVLPLKSTTPLIPTKARGTFTNHSYLSAHAQIFCVISTLPWDQVPKFDNNQRPVAFVAKGSHGMWASAGTFTYVNAVIFKLQDITSDSGVHWDSKDSIVPLSYPDSFSGDLGWLNFKGQWGNKGKTKCWWHFIFPECEIVDGPGGPVRNDVLSAASILSVVATDTASNVQSAPSEFQMTGPLSVRSHLPSLLTG